VLILGMLSLVVGIFAGLGRLGIMLPQFALDQMAFHGILMVASFFGTVIGLERAVAIGQRWAYTAPLLTGTGGLLLILGAPAVNGFALILAGSVIFTIASIQVVRTQKLIHNWILLAGAACLVIGNTLLLNGFPIDTVIYWWISFLLLTIAGERLELSRLVIQNDSKRSLLALLSILPVIGAATISLNFNKSGLVIFSLGLASIGLWLMMFDIARRTIKLTGLTRFTAACMLAGYVWLLVCALLLMGAEFGWGNISRDSALHSFFLGFVFSMVIGHALIIFPAVTGLKIPYSPALYLPMLLLQLTVLVRVVSDLSNNHELLVDSGVANGITLAIFIATLIWRIRCGFKPTIRPLL
ncbi:MAG: hypothetical protein OQL09_07935, partial [Gammaproteobacteria bacterium]|nr:hypothetical protein [Gammaproteobacteria bacterium]